MKLILQIKLKVDKEQKKSLLNTIKEANACCNELSKFAFENKCFNQFKLHHAKYYSIKSSFNLSAQMVVRNIQKVSSTYKLDKKKQRVFKELGAITYDARILSYNIEKRLASIWSVDGRLKIPFIPYPEKYLPYIKGEADLICRKNKFYLFQTIEYPEEEIKDVEEFIGCDFGINSLVTTSDGINHSAEWLNTYREHWQKVRSSIQAKADTSKRSTKRNARKCLKRLSSRERTTANLINHTISKSIVKSAKEQNKGIAIEDLTNIRFTSKNRNKKFRTKLGRWNFADLRAKLEYKALLNGVKLVVVEPAFTSQMCNSCYHIGKRTNKVFKCTNNKCKVDTMDADFNASKNISLLGTLVNRAERYDMLSCSLHY